MKSTVNQRAILRIWSACWFPEREWETSREWPLFMEPHAVLECNDGKLALGREAIRAFYAGVVAVGRKYDFGDQRPAIISGDLALTSTRCPDGSVTAEVARRQGDGTWLWVIDKVAVA